MFPGARVRTQDVSRTDGGLGHTVTDSGVAFAAMLTDPRSAWYQDLNGKTVLELGCGPGLTGLAVAATFPQASVHLTDCNPAILRNLRRTVADQGLDNVVVSELDWHDALDPSSSRALPLLGGEGTGASKTPDLIVASGNVCMYVCMFVCMYVCI